MWQESDQVERERQLRRKLSTREIDEDVLDVSFNLRTCISSVVMSGSPNLAL